jgi:hypothetical protein
VGLRKQPLGAPQPVCAQGRFFPRPVGGVALSKAHLPAQIVNGGLPFTQDLFTSCLRLSWPAIALLFCAVVLANALVFTALYVLDHKVCGALCLPA